jgi:hypothetical protein
LLEAPGALKALNPLKAPIPLKALNPLKAPETPKVRKVISQVNRGSL